MPVHIEMRMRRFFMHPEAFVTGKHYYRTKQANFHAFASSELIRVLNVGMHELTHYTPLHFS